jgi:hypothetical protein
MIVDENGTPRKSGSLEHAGSLRDACLAAELVFEDGVERFGGVPLTPGLVTTAFQHHHAQVDPTALQWVPNTFNRCGVVITMDRNDRASNPARCLEQFAIAAQRCCLGPDRGVDGLTIDRCSVRRSFHLYRLGHIGEGGQFA